MHLTVTRKQKERMKANNRFIDNRSKNMVKFFTENKKKIVEILLVILVIGFVCAIYSKWNDIWYSFGQNIYYMTHSK